MTLPNRPNYVPGQMRRKRRFPMKASSKLSNAPSTSDSIECKVSMQISGNGAGERQMEADVLKLQHDVVQALQELPHVGPHDSMHEQLAAAQHAMEADPVVSHEVFQKQFFNFGALETDVAKTDAQVFPPLVPPVSAMMGRHLASNVQELHKSMCSWTHDPVVKMNYEKMWQNMMRVASTRAPTRGPSSSALLAALGTVESRGPKKRTNLSKEAKTVLRQWFESHLHHPYPTEEEKEWLSREGGITIEQVNNWFINTRGRKWKPMLTRLMAEKEAGNSTLFDQMVERIEEPYRRASTNP